MGYLLQSSVLGEGDPFQLGNSIVLMVLLNLLLTTEDFLRYK